MLLLHTFEHVVKRQSPQVFRPLAWSQHGYIKCPQVRFRGRTRRHCQLLTCAAATCRYKTLTVCTHAEMYVYASRVDTLDILHKSKT